MAGQAFKVGDKVAVISSGFGRWITDTATVDRITPSGQIVLKNRAAKYRPDGHELGNSYSRQHIEVWSSEHDELLAEMAITRMRNRLGQFVRWKDLKGETVKAIFELVAAEVEGFKLD